MSKTRSFEPKLPLAEHHRELETACMALLSTAYADDASALVAEYRKFEQAVLDHIAAEEEEILPGYEEHAPADAREIREDHVRMRQLLFRIGVEVELHTVRIGYVHEMVALLRAHAEHEDAAMYVWAFAQLPANVKERLFDRIRRSSRGLAEFRDRQPTTVPLDHT
jgi:hypothetical protein